MKSFECMSVSCLEKVFSDRRPMVTESKNICFSNESFSFQVAYCAHGQDFTLQRGSWEIKGTLKDFIQIRPVYEVPCTLPCVSDSDDYYLTKKACLVPDLLADENFFGVRVEQWGSLWVSIKGNLPCGNHKIEIILKNKDDIIGRVHYDLQVIREALPQCDLWYAHWVHYDCILQKHNLTEPEEIFGDVVKNYLKNAAQHGANVCFVPLFTPPVNTRIKGQRLTVQLVDVSIENGKWRFNFEKVLRFMQTAEVCGMKYFEMSHLFSQWGAEHPPKIIAQENGRYKQVLGWDDDSLGEKYLNFLDVFLTELSFFLKKHLYLENRVVFHISDEPNAGNIERYLQIRGFVKKRLGNYKIIDALSDFDFYMRKGVDIPVSSTDHAHEFQEKGVQDFWVYYCCAQKNQYLSNRFMSMPLQRVRILGYQLYLAGCKGFLHWGYNYYNSALSEREINPFVVTDADGSFQSGDSFIVYPGKNGPMDSVRHETFFDALQDYRALVLLEKKIGRKKVCAFLHKEGVQSFTQYPKDTLWHISMRRKIIQKCRKQQHRT